MEYCSGQAFLQHHHLIIPIHIASQLVSCNHGMSEVESGCTIDMQTPEQHDPVPDLYGNNTDGFAPASTYYNSAPSVHDHTDNRYDSYSE